MMATSYKKIPDNGDSTKASLIQVMPSGSRTEREGNSEGSVNNIYFERKHVCITSPTVKDVAPETLIYRKMAKSYEENLAHRITLQKNHIHYLGSSNIYKTTRNSEAFARGMLAEYRYIDSSNAGETDRRNEASAGAISTECNYANTNSLAVADATPEVPLHSNLPESSDESSPKNREATYDSEPQNMDYSSGGETEKNCPLEEIPVEVTTTETQVHSSVGVSSSEMNPENRESIEGSQSQNIDYSSVDETESRSQSPLEEIPVEVTFSETAPEAPIHGKLSFFGNKDPVSEEASQDNQVQSLDSNSLDESERNDQKSEGSSFSKDTHSLADLKIAAESKEGNSDGQRQQDNGEKTVESRTPVDASSSSKGLEQQKTDANDKPHKCTLCNASFSKAGNLINHIRAHNYEKPYVCEICSASFSKSGNLVNHVKIHSGEKPFKCDLCDESFAEKESLNTHIYTHTGEKSHKCSICDASFAQLGSLRRHARIHTGEKLHKCTLCKATFSSPGTLRTHIGTHTGEKPYKCTVCEATFLQSSNLKRHQRIHTGEKPYKCTRCVAAFTDTEHLKAHFRTHTGEKPFKCSQCSAAYPRAGSLKAHIRTHTGERRHICNVCCSSFLESSHLKSHLKTHTSEKPHKCTICGAAFLRHESLKSHMRTHTGERPHKCEFCESAFTTSQHLKIHIRTHTGEKPYICKVCSAAFSRTGTLRRHMRTHSSKEPKE